MRKRHKAGIILLTFIVLSLQIILGKNTAYAYEDLSLENMTDMVEEENAQENSRISAVNDILNDWAYTETENSIILIRYIGTSTDIVIPGNIDGKQVFLQNSGTGTGLERFPETTTSIIVGNADQMVKVTDGNAVNLFSGLTKLTYLDARGLDTSDLTSMRRMFSNCSSLTEVDVRGWDTGRVTDMGFMFQGCSSLREVDVSAWNTSRVTNMYSLFRDCSSLTSLDVSSWDTGNVTEISCMFYSCSSLTKLDVSGWDTGNITGSNMDSLFYNCSSLAELDVSDWDTSNVMSMQNIFFNCSSLSRLDLSSWDMSSVVSMNYMFYYCSSLTELNLHGWDTSHVSHMLYTFNNCSKLQLLDLSGHDYSNVMPGWAVGIFDLVDNSAMLPTLIISSDPFIQSICDGPVAGRVPAGPTYHAGEGVFTDKDGSYQSSMKYFDTILATGISDFTTASIANKYIPNKEGAIFSGWYLDKAYTQPLETAGDKMSVTDLLNANLYAKYLNQYTVTFVDYEGSIIKESLVLEGESATAPEVNLVREGYMFIGWDRDFENITENMVIRALYKEEKKEMDSSDIVEVAVENNVAENMQTVVSDDTEEKVSVSKPKTADTSAVGFCGFLLSFSLILFLILKSKKS